MDLLDQTGFENLVNSRGGAHVSLFMPTHRVSGGKEADQDKLRLKNLLSAVGDELSRNGTEREEVERLLAPAWELQRDDPAWSYMSDGLALFLHDGELMRYRIALELPELVVLGERFALGPTIPLLSDQTFLALTISPKRVRVLRGSRSLVDELDLAGVPASLDEVFAADGAFSQPSPGATTSGRAGGTPGTVFYGTGSPDQSHEEDVQQFLRRIADGVQSHLGNRSMPMVLIGLPEWVSGYRKVNRYNRVLDQAIERNPDQMSAEDLHDQAWAIVQREAADEASTLIERLGEQRAHQSGASGHEEVLAAAEEGRIDTMLVTEDSFRRTGNDDRIILLGSGSGGPQEQIDAGAIATLRHGGALRVVENLPDGVRTAAILRY